MSQESDRLRSRREALLQSGELQRLDWQDQLQQIEGSLDGVDRGLNLLRRVATPPVLLAGGVLATLLLGRRRTQRGLAGALLLVAQLALRKLDLGQRGPGQRGLGQRVRRSR